jgi:hypothetical protein
MAIVIACVVGGCSGSKSSGSNETDASDEDVGGTAGASGTGDPSLLVGTFQVKLTPATSQGAAATAVFGKVYDGATPSTIVWESPQVDGDCTLTTPRVPYCSTPCGSAACVEDDTCVAYPTARGVGTVNVEGLQTRAGATNFKMTPIANGYQPPAGTTLEYPPFDEGDAVTFTPAGAYYPGFSLKSSGVAPLVLTSTTLELQSGSPLVLTWDPGSLSTASIHVKLDISHHGGTKGQILCDTSDTGALAISAELMTKLLDLGVAGYPSIVVTRHATGSAVIAAGRVDLDVSSVVEQSVTVEGLASCADDGDCPQGQACQSDLTCSR